MTRFTIILYPILIALTIVSCDTSRNIYRSSPSRTDYWTIKALTLSHCGCTHLYIDHYRKGTNDFKIFYNDNLARKTIYNSNNHNDRRSTRVLLATSSESYTIAFDSVDKEIFREIDSIIINKQAIIYPIKPKGYKGYVIDTSYESQ